MTSVLRRYAQTDPTTGYFTGIPNTVSVNGGSGTLAVVINVWRNIPGKTSNSVMDISGFTSAFAKTVDTIVTTPLLYKDLGRPIVIYDSKLTSDSKVAIMRQVMLVRGQNIEGISDVPPFARNLYYICTWNDGGTATNTLFPLAPVARTG
jgi:hypothetical protein